MAITAPGIYRDIEIADYYNDPCPEPSFTQSLAKLLLDRSPLHAWNAHPRLNPDFERADSKQFDLGSVAHRLLFDRGRPLAIGSFDDWRTKDARQFRTEAIRLGNIPVLEKDFDTALAMMAIAQRRLDWWNRELGSCEVCLAWQEQDIWLRQLLDWLDHKYLLVIDYKTTRASASPQDLSRRMLDNGWHIQAAMADRALAQLAPENAGFRSYLFIVQECEPPYELSIAEIGEHALTIGRKMLDHAITVWIECMQRRQWPGYSREPIVPEFPGWAGNRLHELELPKFSPQPITELA